jgi:transmembrane sensor
VHSEFDDIDWTLLARVLAGRGTAADRRVVEARAAADPDFAVLEAELRDAWRRSGVWRENPDVDAALVAIHRKIATRRPSLPGEGRRWAAFVRPQPALWAAALIVAVGLSALLVHDRFAPAPRPAPPKPAAVTEVATPRGQQARVQLADGSHVILGVASRLRYRRDFGDSTREVTLEGEAYFDVVHDGRVPFRVRTAQGVTEDVGTQFAVRAYPEDRRARVVVEAGRVAVGNGVLLDAGDVAFVAPDAPPTVRHHVRVGPLIRWTNGTLAFVDAPLSDVVLELQRWYEYDVRLAGPGLASRRITASFGKAPIDEVIDFIARALDLRVERRDHARVLFAAPR